MNTFTAPGHPPSPEALGDVAAWSVLAFLAVGIVFVLAIVPIYARAERQVAIALIVALVAALLALSIL